MYHDARQFPDKWIFLKLLKHFEVRNVVYKKKVRNANLATLDITMLKTMKKKTNGVTSLHTSCMYDTLDQQKTWHNLLSPSLSLNGLVSF